MASSEKSLSHDGSEEHGTRVVEVASEPSWSPEAERKLVQKIDLYLIPTLWLMSLLSWMDRANLGNASIAGLNADLQLSSTQFSLSITVFYFGYIAAVPFVMTLLARTRPSLTLPIIMLLWGVVTCGMGAVKTYPQLLGLRIVLGSLEAVFNPGVCFIFSSWYKPDEMGKRAGSYITAALMGGAFGSLIAGGVMQHLEGARGIRGWRWLFIVEGAVTIFTALLAMYLLLDYPATCRKFTPEERVIAVKRLQRVGVHVAEGNDDSKPARLGLRRSVVMVLTNWRTYGIAIACGFFSATLLMAYFYPVLVKGLGYDDPITAQYMTVPIWVVGFVFAVSSGSISDRMPQYRALIIAACLGLNGLMAAITCGVYDFKARYVLLAFMTGGVWGGFTQAMAFTAELFQHFPPEVRALALGIMSIAANTGNIYGAYIFPKEHAPKYLLGFGMVAATGTLSGGIFALMWYWGRREKRICLARGEEPATPCR
ncbi:major facilitator superfamily domain-containing protein [Apodospora peruviana]|uniref:Major facilitator superfamily domain-containing protein n=1 Tax=Apodospora peruviana TaxID=516989 RepID=A0AAE0HW19_9PEZI|nr:major facilitator superfamily domain-containing protein [Apodospora peruviana]